MTTSKKKEEIEDRWDKWNSRLTKLGLYLFGIFLAYNEFIIRKEDVRWLVVMFVASVLSIPLVTTIDETIRKRSETAQKE